MSNEVEETNILPPDVYAALNLDEFVAVDIETTGLQYTNSEVIEVAAAKFRNGELAETFERLIKPATAIPEYITKLTGIADSDVAGAPAFRDVLPDFREFLGTAPIIAHHVPFDLPFLEYHARLVDRNLKGWQNRKPVYHYFPNPKYDTAVLARMYLHYLPSFSLSNLVDYFQFSGDVSHRALPDAKNAGLVFRELVNFAIQTKFADVQKILQILEAADDPISDFFQHLAKFLSTGATVVGGIDRRQFDFKANHYNIIGERSKLKGPADLLEEQDWDYEPPEWEQAAGLLNESDIADFFAESGELSQKFGTYETRDQQVAMATAIARAFNSQQFLTVEAGTGTGKSLAYLVPAIQWALKNNAENGRVVISTNTKNLQEQLFFKDLPVLSGILKDEFKAVLLKGRGNYLCLDKWTTVMRDPDTRLTEDERAKVLPLLFWMAETETGDIAENNAFRVERNGGLWSKFIAESQYCPGQKCKYFKDCYLMKARENARNAHLVLVNHSLLFADLVAEHSVISPYRNLIFDEAHNLEKTATEYLGVAVNLWLFKDLTSKLYVKEKFESGALAQLVRNLRKSEMDASQVDTLTKQIDKLIENVLELWATAQDFFRELGRQLRQITPENQTQYASRHRYKSHQIFEPVLPIYDQLARQINRLQAGLANMVEYFRDFKENSFDNQDQIYRELKTQTVTAAALLESIDLLLSANDETRVYWYELPQREDSLDIRLYAAPLNIGELLHEQLFGKLRTAIFTSATIAVNQRFDYFLERTGINRNDPDRVKALMLDSPFRYREQVLLGIASFLPPPTDKRHFPELKKLIRELSQRLRRGSLVLFTSYSTLNEVYRDVQNDMKLAQMPLLAQGLDGGRHAIISRFKREKPAFLFGTDSFWEGVDIPGDALELVAITKLPFDVPTDPVFQAKSEMIEARGGNSFYELSIPEAVIRFRQGFGRLIRSRQDFGAVLILDNRVSTKSYGRMFLNSLPVTATSFANADEMWLQLERWFR